MAAKVPFRGGFTCSCVATSLPLVELVMLTRGLINESIDVYQLGYRGDVSASAGTHNGGGNTDVGQFTDAHIAVWRWAGWTIQHRTKAQGFDMAHGHGWPYRCTHLSPSGRAQSIQWENGTNGLVSRGPIQGPHPVVSWQAGIKRMEEDLTKFADDIVNRTAEKVLNLDGEIANVYTGNPANKFVAVKTALPATHNRVKAVEAKVDKLQASVDALVKKLGA